MQDPIPYLSSLDIDLHCAIENDEIAALDSTRARRINYEWFFFSSLETVIRFDEDPLAYCGILTDPVTLDRFVPGDDSPIVEHEGVPYYFWSDSTRITFQMMPAMYAQPNYKMIRKDAAEAEDPLEEG